MLEGGGDWWAEKNSVSHPRGLGDTCSQSCGHRFWVCCSLSLSAFFSSLETPPLQRQSFSVVSRRGPQGPSIKTGEGQRCCGRTSAPWERPQSPASPRPQAPPGLRRLGCLPLPSSSPPHTLGPSDLPELNSLAVAGTGTGGHYPGGRGFGRPKRPPPTPPSSAN